MSPPLAGVRVVVTRPRTQAPAFSSLLEASGARVVEIPTVEIVEPPDWGPVDDALDRLGDYRVVLFTSANGVERFLGRLEESGASLAGLRGATLVAIGPATADALRSRALSVAIVPDDHRAEGVLEAMEAVLGPALDGCAILLPRALEAREVLPDGLRARGARVDVAPVYQAVLPGDARRRARDALDRGFDLITFTSSSTVRNLLRVLEPGDRERLRQVVVGCIGPVTRETAEASGLQVAIQPRTYTVDAFHRAIVEHYRKA